MKKIKLLILSIISYSLFLFSFTLWAPTILLLNKIGIVKKTAFQSSLKLWGVLTTKLMPCTLEVTGTEHVDKDKNYVFILNHQSMMDITLALGHIPKNFVFLAKKELASVPIFGRVMKALQFIPVDRSNPKKAIRSLREAGQLMAENNLSVSIFAEGTRTRTGKIGKFKKGGFILAESAGVEIIPVSIDGNFKLAPSKSLFYMDNSDLKLRIHEPVQVVDREITDVMAEVEAVIRGDFKWKA